MLNYEHLAIDEVYDILLYNPGDDDELKINLINNLLTHYLELEEYEKCGALEELKKVMRKENESNNKKT
tara:strand:+ start:1048 stop:1254 length:207 start_codon:yes stop_codon:yes gene_type:complete